MSPCGQWNAALKDFESFKVWECLGNVTFHLRPAPPAVLCTQVFRACLTWLGHLQLCQVSGRQVSLTHELGALRRTLQLVKSGMCLLVAKQQVGDWRWGCWDGGLQNAYCVGR